MYKKGESVWSTESIVGVKELQERFKGAGLPVVIKRSGFKGYLSVTRTDAWEFVVTRDLAPNETAPLQRLVIHLVDYHNDTAEVPAEIIRK
jgi:hypothetical protein